MTLQRSTRGFLAYAVAILAGVLALGLTVAPRVVHAVTADPVTAAWEKARAAGSYRFTSDVKQTTIPIASVTNVGRSSRTDQLHLEGQSNLQQQKLALRLWSDGGSVVQSDDGVAIKIENGKSYVRQKGGQWRESEGVLEAIAPQGDFLAYLQAVRQVQSHPPEQRGGISFTRYSFTVDGPSFANYLRDRMEEALRAKGELPPGVTLNTPSSFSQMTGDGELWVGQGAYGRGLPLRQILNLQFPEQQNDVISAQIVTDFSHYGEDVKPVVTGGAGLIAWVAWLGVRMQDFSAMLALLPMLALCVLILCYRRQRVMQAALVTVVITSLVIGPLLQTLRIDAFFTAQAAKAADRQEQQAATTTAKDVKAQLGQVEFNPHANPMRNVESVRRNFSALRLPHSALAAAPLAATTVITQENGVDTDADGLSDFVEERVGTSEVMSDTDGDGLPDNIEVRGFSYAGKTWYTNPQALDSNDDGIPDETEWGRNVDGTLRATPLDTDNDGIPDLFDLDNDNDGVPDRLDLSPFTKGTSTASEAHPFKLTISNLTAGMPTFVDFQLRPTVASHLAFAFNVLDWPRNDNQGQVQDIDGGTYADLAAAQGRTATPNEAYGDMKLIPMLEIRMADNGVNLPSQSDLTPYNIVVNNVTQNGSQIVVYVPLSLMTDEQTGQRVGFTGRMRYLPSGNWPAPHEVRLAWVVQTLVDLACDKSAPDAAQQGCGADGYIHNVPQVVQSYYDDWTLTGLNISEQHGAKTAIIYEDPAHDANLHDDAGLVALTHGFDESFLAARDQDGNQQRDVTLDRIAQNLASVQAAWAIPNTFGVQSASYPTFDQAVMYTAMTDTLSALSPFNAYWSTDHTLMPTLLYAYEENSRAMSLDAIGTGGNYLNLDINNNLNVDFQPAQQPSVETVTVAGLKWAHYCRNDQGTGWELCPADVSWQELQSRYGNPALPGDPNDPDVQAGRLAITQLYDLALTHGVNNAVQRNNTLIAARYSLKDDPAIASTVRSALALTSIAVVFLVNVATWARFQNITVVAELGKMVRSVIQKTQGNIQAARELLNGGEFRAGVVILGLKVLVVAGVVTAAVFAAATHGQDQRIALRAMVLGLQTFLSLIDPVLTFARVSTIGVSLSFSSEYVGLSRTSLVVGTVIAIAVVWGFFIYSMVSNHVSAFSPEFNRALAETIAATIYLIILALISATIIGLILVGVVAVIDAVLTAICELGVDDLRKAPGLGGACFTLGTVAIKAIAYALYNYDVMIDTSRNNFVAPGAPDTQLADPSKGFVTGNAISITMPITTNIAHKSPDAANGLMINFYLYFFSATNLRSTTVNYSLSQPNSQDLSANRGDMRSDWKDVHEDHKYVATTMYGGHATTTPPPVGGINLPPGINQAPSFFLNMGYALPAYECWAIPEPFTGFPIPVCYTRTFSGHTSTKIETLHYDIFPASFAQFVTLATKPDGGQGLAWDSHFPSLADADGDGLVANTHGGLDPNDATWDTDNDGLSDAYELQRRQDGVSFSPVQCDTDGDGLTDAQEAYFGANPANRDTDNDGLSDAEEVWHQVYNTSTCLPTPAWTGGWDVVAPLMINAATPFAIHVTSDPLRADSDDDGINDLAEKQLAQQVDVTKRLDDQNRPYHPGVFNSSPIKIYPSIAKRYVRPGESVTYTNTIVANVAVMPSVLDVTLPGSALGPFGPSPEPTLLNFMPATFSGSQMVTQHSVMTAQPGLNTQTATITSSVRARLTDTGPATLAWDPLVPQTLGSASPLVRFSTAAASLMDRQDNYLISALLSDSASPGGSGAIQTNAIPSGQSGTLVNDAASNGATVRGATAPDVACNNAGACMVVWEQHDRCNTLTVNYLTVVTSGESGGIEPVIYFIPDYNDTDPTDGGYQLVWNPLDPANNGRSLGSGVQRGPNANGFPITLNLCTQGRIDIYEADTENVTTDYRTTDWSHMALIGSSLRIGPDNRNTDPSGTDRFTRSGITSVVDLNLSILRKNLDTIQAALVGPTGTVVRAPFAIPSALPISQTESHNFRPVVASDGSNFVVVSELADATAYKTYLQTQQFDASGMPSSIPVRTLPLEDLRVAVPTVNSVAADVAFIGTRYRIARKFIRPSGDQTIYVTDDVLSASPAQWTTAATAAFYDERGAPVLAYNPRADQTLLLYEHSTTEVRRILYQGANLTPILGDARLGFIENTGFPITSQDPARAVYNPMANAWLLSWTTPSGFGTGMVYSLWRPDLSVRLITDQKVAMVDANFNSRAQSCPAVAALPAADLRFEELPGATSFVDSTGRGNGAACNGSACPVSAVPGAVDAQGNAAGVPSSDYAVRFDGVDDAITLPNPYQYTGRSNFSFAFWYKAGVTNQQNAQFWISGIDASGYEGVRLAVYNNSGRIGFGIDGYTSEANTNLNDGRWHFVVATRNDLATGSPLNLYLDGNPTAIASSNSGMSTFMPTTFQIGGVGNIVSLDQFQVYTAALSGNTVRDLYTRSLQSYCVGTNYDLGQYQWRKLNVSQPDVRGGKLTTSAGLTVTIDSDLPTSAIGGLTNNQYILGNTIHTIGGNANDVTSGVASMEVNVNNSGWQVASGAATWAYNLAVTEGRYTIQSRATDVAGNVETPGSGLTVIADATPPNVTLNALPTTPISLTRNAAGLWTLALVGTASDPTSGGQPGSGVQPGSVEVLLQGGSADGNDWQPVTLNGNNWSLNYTFANGVLDPTGAYTVSVRAADNVGNQSYVTATTLRIDNAGPMATLSDSDATRTVISNTVTLSGVITDTGAAGLNQLEIAFTPVEAIAALSSNVSNDQADAQLHRIWLPVTLAQKGAGVAASPWSVQVPAGLEGEYQIDLRATDLLGNVLRTANVWRGVIDTQDPRVAISAMATGNSYFDNASSQTLYEVRFVCAAVDRHLSEGSFSCPGNALQPPVRAFDNYPALQALFPDLTIRSGLANTYTLWSPTTTPAATARACDNYGRCAQASTPGTVASAQLAVTSEQSSVSNLQSLGATPGAPQAVVVAPAAERVVAGSNALSVTVAAEAGASLKQVTISLDNNVIQTLNFAQADVVTRTLRTVGISGVSEGRHILTARASDWANGTQATVFPVNFVLDTQAPALTLDTATVTLSDTWQAGSGILRFHGGASDAIGLATVQIRTGTQPFVDATFGNGQWHTALPVVDPEGKTLTVTVRAIDLANRVTQVSRSVGTNLSVPDAPDTSITSGPANPSAVNTASFVFTGTPGGREVATFECQLDTGAYLPCASPQSYSDLSKGDHSFRVRAIDSQGFVDLSPASFTWTVNASPLDATITSSPVNPSSSRTASFNFTGTGTAFDCALDAAAFTTCASPESYSGLADGDHTFQVRARSGSQTGAAARYTWTVVNAAPIANSQTLTTTENLAIALTLGANDADPLTYRVGTPAHGVLLGVPPTLTYTPDTGFFGTDSFTFRANDGQTDSNIATVNLTIIPRDKVPPVSTVTLAPVTPNGLNNWYKTPVHVTVTATDGTDPKASGVGETRCVLDPASAPATFVALPIGCGYTSAGTDVITDGVHTVYAASKDKSGNQEVPVSMGFQIDHTPPVVRVTGVTSGITYPLGAAPTAGCNTTDATAGVATAATLQVTGGNAQGVGNFTATCSNASDKAGNVSTAVTAAYTVTYNLNKFVVLGQEGVALGQLTTVVSGDVGARSASLGPFLADNAEVSIGQSVKLQDASSHLLGNRLVINQLATVYNPSYNTWTNRGAVKGTPVTPLNLNLMPSLPALPPITPGTQNMNVAPNGTLTLDPGSYGSLTVGQYGTVTFKGGLYQFQSWSINQYAKLYFQAASDIRVAGKVSMIQYSTLGPAPTAPLVSAKDIVLYVAGQNGMTGTLGDSPKAVAFGQGSTLNLNVLAPNGTLQLDQGIIATGAFLARWVNLGQQAKLTLAGRFGAGNVNIASLDTGPAPLNAEAIADGSTTALYLPLVLTNATATDARESRESALVSRTLGVTDTTPILTSPTVLTTTAVVTTAMPSLTSTVMLTTEAALPMLPALTTTPTLTTEALTTANTAQGQHDFFLPLIVAAERTAGNQ